MSQKVTLPACSSAHYTIFETRFVAQAHEISSYYGYPKMMEDLLKELFKSLKERQNLEGKYNNFEDTDDIILRQISPELVITVLLSDYLNLPKRTENIRNILDDHIHQFMYENRYACSYKSQVYYNEKEYYFPKFLLMGQAYQSFEFLVSNLGIDLYHGQSYEEIYQTIKKLEKEYLTNARPMPPKIKSFYEFVTQVLCPRQTIEIIRKDQKLKETQEKLLETEVELEKLKNQLENL